MDRLSDRSSILLTSTRQGRAPAPNSALLYVRRFFIAAHQFYLKSNHCFALAGISRQGFFVNTQSHRCDNSCVTFTYSGACPCTISRRTFVRRYFFVFAQQALFINQTLFRRGGHFKPRHFIALQLYRKKRVMPISAIHVFISMPTFSISLFE